MRTRFRWQNLNEKPGTYDAEGRPPTKGRAWLRVNRAADPEEGEESTWLERLLHSYLGELALSVEWNIPAFRCALTLGVADDDQDFMLHAALPPVDLYLSVENPLARRLARWLASLEPSDMGSSYSGRDVGLRVFEWAIWWQVWVDDSGWTSTRPRWRDGSFSIPDFFLGRTAYRKELLRTERIHVHLPEGSYPVDCALELSTWKRPRWFATERRTANVDIPGGIPIPGKGENSWDCNDDALLGKNFLTHSLGEIAGGIVESVTETRLRYGGKNWRPEPKKPPEGQLPPGGAPPPEGRDGPVVAVGVDFGSVPDSTVLTTFVDGRIVSTEVVPSVAPSAGGD